jgi:hypothetical protein
LGYSSGRRYQAELLLVAYLVFANGLFLQASFEVVLISVMLVGLLTGFSVLFILRILRAFPTAEKRGKKPPADEKAGRVLNA